MPLFISQISQLLSVFFCWIRNRVQMIHRILSHSLTIKDDDWRFCDASNQCECVCSGRMASSNCQRRPIDTRDLYALILLLCRPARNNHKFRLTMSLYSIFIRTLFENDNAANSCFSLHCFRFCHKKICEQDHKLCQININQNRDDFLISLCSKKGTLLLDVFFI